jgi:hypothetical protein
MSVRAAALTLEQASDNPRTFRLGKMLFLLSGQTAGQLRAERLSDNCGDKRWRLGNPVRNVAAASIFQKKSFRVASYSRLDSSMGASIESLSVEIAGSLDGLWLSVSCRLLKKNLKRKSDHRI